MNSNLLELPTDKQAEMYVLGSCMLSVHALSLATESLRNTDFGFPEHGIIFESIYTLAKMGRPVNAVLLTQELKSNESVSSIASIFEIVSAAQIIANSADYEYYIRIVKDCSNRRSAILFSQELIRSASNKKLNFNTQFLDFQKKIKDLESYSHNKLISVREILENFSGDKNYEQQLSEDLEEVRQGKDLFNGFRTGYKKLDTLIGGFKRGTLTYIGARSSSGKTTLIINLMINLFNQYPNLNIGFFSLEMNKDSIVEKYLTTIAQVDPKNLANRMLNRDEHERIIEACSRLKNENLFLYFKNDSITQLQKIIKKHIQKDRLDLVFIDYLTRIKASQKMQSKHLEIDQISKGLQDISLELNMPIISLAQLNRAIAHRTDKKPVMSDLRESGSLEEDADNVLLLHRPAHYDKNVDDVTEIIVAKNRLYGLLGEIKYDFSKGRLIEHGKITELMPSNVIASNRKKDYDFDNEE